MLNDYRYKITQEQIEKARELRATGLSQQKVADELGLTRIKFSIGLMMKVGKSNEKKMLKLITGLI